MWAQHSPRPELKFESRVLSTLEALFSAWDGLDGKLIHKSRLRSGCSSSLQAAGSIGKLFERSCWKKSAISTALGLWNARILCSGTGTKLRIVLLLWGGHSGRWV